MWQQIVAAVGGAIVGGITNAAMTANAIDKKIKAYADASKEVRDAAEKYSGKNAYNEMVRQGKDMSSTMGDMTGSALAAERLENNNPGVTGAGAMANAYQNAGTSADAAGNAAQGGFQAGMNNASTELNSKYNKATTRANQLMAQADIDYNVTNQRNKEIMDTVANSANTYKQVAPTIGGGNNNAPKTSNGRQVD